MYIDLNVVKERFTSGGPTVEEIRQKIRSRNVDDTKPQMSFVDKFWCSLQPERDASRDKS